MKCLLHQGKNVNIGAKYLLNPVHVISKLEAKNVLNQKIFFNNSKLERFLLKLYNLSKISTGACNFIGTD